MSTIKIMNPKKIIIVEYSREQGCFHYNSLDEAIRQNVWSIINERHTDYLIIGIAATFKEAESIEKAFMSLRKEERGYA